MSLLAIHDLRVALPVGREHRDVLRGIDVDLAAGQSLALVGESGSGKSMTARAIARLLPDGAETSGTIRFDGHDVLGLKGSDLRRYQDREVAMIFQDPRVHMNPVRTIGDFLIEGLITHRRLGRHEARQRVIALLDEVGITGGAQRLRQYPHQLSGGMLQRVMIAAALVGEPRVLLADEPTTALDMSTQAEVVAIMKDACAARGAALISITHDLELALAVCDRVAVMYAGQIVELRGSRSVEARRRHPYSAGLFGARPNIAKQVRRLNVIPGRPKAAFEVGAGCAFADRCRFATDHCFAEAPPLTRDDDGAVRCWRADEIEAELRRETGNTP